METMAAEAYEQVEDDYAHEEDPGHQGQDSAMAALANELESKKESAIRSKLPIERRWLEDERQYWGIRVFVQDDESDSMSEAPPIDNKTAEKVELAAARVGDMLFPTNDPNWALNASPHPTDIDGQEIDARTANAAVDEAEDLIADYLNQCQYPKHGRNAIHDSCRLGVGVLKGPYSKMTSRKVVRRSWQEIIDETTEMPMVDEFGQPMQSQVIQLETIKDTNPASIRVDPWMFFPLPCRSMDECAGAFEMHLYKESKMSTLVDQGMDENALRDLMTRGPTHSEHESSLLEEREGMLIADTGDSEDEEKEFVVWEYHGAIKPTLLRRLGIIDQDDDDPLDMFWGEVWFCQGKILKVELNAILGDERVPYYVVPYRRDHANIMNSHGVPRIMRDAQRTIDMTYEAAQYNTRVTSGPQVAVWEEYAEPADGNWLIDGPKTWRIKDARVKSINDIIQFYQPQSAMDNILPLYEIAVQNADTATQLPMLAHGEAANTVQQTASGMQMVMNAQNIVQRKFAHAWDDEVTLPMLTRYYWWLMEFHEDDSIKVEMQVDPRGASYLLVKDKQAQHSLMFLQMALQDPELKSKIKMDDLYKLALSSMDIPVERLWKSEEEVANEPPDPMQEMQQRQAAAEVEEAEARAIKAQAEADEAVIHAQMAQQGGGEDMAGRMELERELIRADTSSMENRTKIMIAQMERDGRMAEAVSNREISMAELSAKLQVQERDREIDTMLRRMEQQRAERHEAAQDFMQGFKLRLEANEQSLRAKNLKQGYDTFG